MKKSMFALAVPLLLLALAPGDPPYDLLLTRGRVVDGAGAPWFVADVGGEGEGLLFVWKGAIQVKGATQTCNAGERDTVFISGPAHLQVTGDSAQAAEVIQVQAPPQPGS